ncbi:MAG: hypothetical protein JRJ78_14750 [Deltaproteobacteria bacterium]|nr:hypothetical protein [Deltaproteobacteria bacterium]
MRRDRAQAKWRAKKQLFWETRVKPIIAGLVDYWPLTVRQIHYQLTAACPAEYPNTRKSYIRVVRLLTEARLQNLEVAGRLLWEAVEDRSRSWTRYSMWRDRQEFIEGELEQFLRVDRYSRDRLQGQDLSLQLWVEKDALAGIFRRVAAHYGVPVIAARGYSSISFAHECRLEVERAAEAGLRTRLLYFGDCDPSGWDMLPAMLTTLQDELRLGSLVEGERVALLPEQVFDRERGRYLYPPAVIKDGDTRTAGYRDALQAEGFPTDLAVELDALPPDQLEGMIKAAIEDNLNMDAFHEALAREREDLTALSDVRARAMSALRGAIG